MAIYSSTTSAALWRRWAYDAIQGTGATELIGLSDVDTAGQSAGNALMSDGGNYYGRAIVEADISDLGSYLLLAGGTMTGQIVGIAPTGDTHLTRKDYVDEETLLNSLLLMGA